MSGSLLTNDAPPFGQASRMDRPRASSMVEAITTARPVGAEALVAVGDHAGRNSRNGKVAGEERATKPSTAARTVPSASVNRRSSRTNPGPTSRRDPTIWVAEVSGPDTAIRSIVNGAMPPPSSVKAKVNWKAASRMLGGHPSPARSGASSAIASPGPRQTVSIRR